MNNYNHPQHDDRTSLYDHFAGVDERTYERPRHTRRTPPRASTWTRIVSYLQRPQARPAIVVGLSAFIAVGGLTAIARSSSGTAAADEPVDAIPTEIDESNMTGSGAAPVVASIPSEIIDPNNGVETTPPLTPPIATTVPAPQPAPAPVPPTPDTVAPAPVPTPTPAPEPDPGPEPDPIPDPGPTHHDPTEHAEKLVMWSDLYLGYWEGDQFFPARWGELPPSWALDAEIELLDQAGATVSGTVEECGGEFVFNQLTPDPTGVGGYRHTAGAPFEASNTNTDEGEQALISLLAEGVPVDMYQSRGAPFAADGTADRLLWEINEWGSVNWIATYDIETNTIRSVQGESGTVTDGGEIGAPDETWVDLDNDGNLESMHSSGDVFALVEWATGEEIWVGSPNRCG